MKDVRVTESVRDVLKDSTLGNNSLTLPPRDLGSKLYSEVKSCLEKLDGKWSTQGQCFLFATGGVDRVRQLIETGKAIHRRNTYQEFLTPPKLAAKMVELICAYWRIKPVEGGTFRVLEPSAGTGNLVRAMTEGYDFVNGLHVVAMEIQLDSLQQIQRDEPTLTKVFGNFLKVHVGDKNFDEGFHAVLMNPPFDRIAWARHIEHAIAFMHSEGCLVSVVPRSAKLSDMALPTVAKAYITPVEADFDGTTVKVSIFTFGIDKDLVEKVFRPIRAASASRTAPVLDGKPLKSPEYYLREINNLQKEIDRNMRELSRELKKCCKR